MRRAVLGFLVGAAQGALLSAVFIGVPVYFWFDDIVAFVTPWLTSAK